MYDDCDHLPFFLFFFLSGRKSKKLKKLASKLSMRRRLDYRAPLEETQQHPLPQSYQPLIEGEGCGMYLQRTL